MKSLTLKLSVLLLLLFTLNLSAGIKDRDKNWDNHSGKVLVYTFRINKEIGPAMWRITKQSMEEAHKLGANLIIVYLNTYGGIVVDADSIRTKILNSSIPVYVFIENNAASAGAFISIAADRIYMHEGASIGAASVVDQTGAIMPEKHQSFMRSRMRSTAEAHGKDTIINGNDTIFKWRRDPKIAEAMVDPRIFIPNINDSGKVVSFTTEEAVKHGYCEGIANSINDLLKLAGVNNYEIKEYKLTGLEKTIGFLVSPVIQGILIMLIIAGIYYELQTPGIGFPLGVAVTAALLYFAPLYLEGLAAHWEIVLFFVGLILIGIEIFAIPGFGITGISGIVLVIISLTLSLVNNVVFELDFSKALMVIFRSLSLVIISITISLVLSIYFSKKLVTSSRFTKIALAAEQRSTEGYIGVEDHSGLIGKTGIALTILRPSGKIEIDNEIYDAVSEIGYINPGEKIKVTRYETGQAYVLKEA
jgi:membrane-bound serine protease (ClpP class)